MSDRAVTLAAVAYDRSNLHANEQIVVDEHPHWIMLMWSVVWVVLAIAFGIFLLVQGWTGWFGTGTKWVAILALVVSLLYLAQRLIKWYSTNFVITTDRCIYREGIISKRGIEIPLDRINTVFFHQRIVERIRSGVRPADIAVLYRSHRHARELQVELLRCQLPFVVRSGQRVSEQAHVRDALAFLLEVRLDEGPLGEEEAFRRLDKWWADRQG